MIATHGHRFGQSQECEKDYKCKDKPADFPANWGRAGWKTVFHKQVYRCNNSKRKTRENVGSPISGAGDHVTKNMERSMFLITFYALVFTGKICLQESWAPEKVWNKDDLPLVEEDQVREHLNRLDIQKSMGSDRMHL